MTQEQLDQIHSEVIAEVNAFEKEIADHNEQVLKSLGKKAQRDFEELLDGCHVTEKIKLVDGPKGHDNQEDCGVFKNVHVDQWSTNEAGDTFTGFIYANVKGQWVEVPFHC